MMKKNSSIIKYKIEKCGTKFFPLCLILPMYPLIRIVTMELEVETIEKFKSKNYEYKIPFSVYIGSKYWRYFTVGYVIMCVISIVGLPWTLPKVVLEFSRSRESAIGITFAYIVSFLFVVGCFIWSIYFKDNVKINHEGVYYKSFFEEKLIQWEKIEDVVQISAFCILILKDRNIFRKYIIFLFEDRFFFLLPSWNKEIDEVCKFIKFKIMESKGEI